MFGDDWGEPYGEQMRRHQHGQHQHQQPKGFQTPYAAAKDKSIILLRANGDRMKFTLKYMDREYYDVAKQHFPHTEDEVHIPEHFATLTYGKPPFSPCVYTATTDYLQARWGRKLDESDRDWLGSHPYAADGGVPREYMPTCVQQMLEPYGMGVSRINIRRGVLMIPSSLFDWMRSLGCNPFAMVDHQTTNKEAAEKLGVPLADANKMWRVEFSAEPLPCSITGEQNFSVPTGQTVKVGDKGGHARYLPPRGYFNDWFISCQLDALDRIEYFVPTPNPEYVPRRGDPSLSLSSIRRPDGKQLAVQAKKGYSTYWVSPEEAQEIAEKLAATPQTPISAIPPIPVISAPPPPKEQSAVPPRNKDVIDVLKLPRVYMEFSKAVVPCPVKGCRQEHEFPVGTTLRYVEKHTDLMLIEWLCFTCRERFTTTYAHTSKKAYRRYLQESFDTRPVTPPVQSGGAGLQRSFPGFCTTCARQMDPAKIGADGKCDDCWAGVERTPDPADAAPAPAVPATRMAATDSPGDFHCCGCEETYDDSNEELDHTGICRECVSIAFEGLLCPDASCRQDLADEQYLPHFISYDQETNSFDWSCVKCTQIISLPDSTEDVEFLGVVALSRVMAMPDALDVKAQREILDDWMVVREMLEEGEREASSKDADTPDDEAMMPVNCPECRKALGNTTCEAVERTADGSIIFACTNDREDGKPCGAVMYVRAPYPQPPHTCPECKRSNDVVPPTDRGIAYTEMQVQGYHLYVQVYNCTMCSKNYLDLRGSSTLSKELEVANAGS